MAGISPENAQPASQLSGLGQSHPPYLKALHIDTRYLRLPEPLELEGEAVVSLAATDLVAICSVMDICQHAMDEQELDQKAPWLEDLAFTTSSHPGRSKACKH